MDFFFCNPAAAFLLVNFLPLTVTCEYQCRLTAKFVSRCLLQNGGRKVSIFIKRMSRSVFPTIWRGTFRAKENGN